MRVVLIFSSNYLAHGKKAYSSKCWTIAFKKERILFKYTCSCTCPCDFVILIPVGVCIHYILHKHRGVCTAYIYTFSILYTWMCVWDTMAVPGSVLLLCVLRAAKEFMLFLPCSLPRLPAILGKSKLQSFSVWLACVVPNLYLTYPSCSVPLPPPSYNFPHRSPSIPPSLKPH